MRFTPQPQHYAVVVTIPRRSLFAASTRYLDAQYTIATICHPVTAKQPPTRADQHQEPICNRALAHITFPSGCEDQRLPEPARLYSKRAPLRTKSPPPKQKKDWVLVQAKRRRSKQHLSQNTTHSYIWWWWCSGDRLEGSIVPNDTRLCMSRSSTLSSIRGDRKGRLRFCFAYMSVM
jgi:hypothetical protein